LVTQDGYPLPFPTSSVEPTVDGFRLTVPRGAPWSQPFQGKGCLNFEGDQLQVGVGGRFVGDVESAGDHVLFHVDHSDHSLPFHPVSNVVGEIESVLFPPDHVREQMMTRLHAELARRGAAMPVVRDFDHA
jgi:hypothetical protein